MLPDLSFVIMSPMGALMLFYLMGNIYIIPLKLGVIFGYLGVQFYFDVFYFFNKMAMFTIAGFKLCRWFNISDEKFDPVSRRVVIIVRGIIYACVASYISFEACLESEICGFHTLTGAFAWFDVCFWFYDFWAHYQVMKHVFNRKGHRRHTFYIFCKVNYDYFIKRFFYDTYLFFIIILFRHVYCDCVLGLYFFKEIWTAFEGICFIINWSQAKESKLYSVMKTLQVVSQFLVQVLMVPSVFLLYLKYLMTPKDIIYVEEIMTVTLEPVNYFLIGIYLFGLGIYIPVKFKNY